MKQGWEIKKLKEVCEIVNGGTPDTNVQKYWDGENLWITPKDMGKLESIYVEDTLRKITDEGLKNSSAKILPINSIILSSRAPIGHLAINKKPISTNQGCKGLVPKKEISTLFLYYFLSKSIDLLNSLGTGATFRELSGSKLETVEIPLPPLPDQQRIVARVEEIFASVAKEKANAEQNLKNAKELFESYLESVFENKHKNWEYKELSDICELIMGQSPPGKSYNTNNHGVPLINGPVEFGKEPFSKTIKSKFTTEPTKYCKENDLILCVRGSTTGRINIAGFNACIGRGVAAIRYSKNQVWLNYFIRASRQKIYYLGQGATFPNVSTDILKKLIIPLPPYSEQQFIVQKLDALSAETKKLEAIYQKKIEDLEELKKSILRKAFAGELKTTKTITV